MADIAGTFGTRLLLLPITMLGSIVAARALQPEGRGIYASAVTLTNFILLVGSPGLGKAAIYYLGRSTISGPDVRRTAFWLSVANGVALSGVLVVTAYVVVPRWLPDLPTSAVLLAAPLAFLGVLRGIWESFLRAAHRNLQTNIGALLSSAVMTGSFIVIAWAGRLDEDTAILIRVVATAVAALAAAVMLKGHQLPSRLPSVSWPTARLLLTYGVPYATMSLAQSMNYDFDILLVQRFLGNGPVGHYSIAASFSEILWYLPMAVGFVLFPRAAAMSGAAAARETATFMRWTFALTLVGSLFIAVAAKPIVLVMYGRTYLPAVDPLRLLLIGTVTCCWYHVLSAYLSGQGKLRQMMIASMAGVVLNVAFNVALIPRMGLEGAALGSTISYTVTGLLALYFFSEATALPMREGLLPSRGEVTYQLERARSLAVQMRGRLGRQRLARKGDAE